MANNPDWKFKFWTDRQRDAPCNGMETILIKKYPFPLLSRCYEPERGHWGEKSDVLRFEILYRLGGVYVDHDANCLQSFDGLHGAYDFYCGLEAPHPVVAGLSITAGNGVIGSRPGHPVVKEVIDLIDQRWDELALKYSGKDGFSKTQIVMERTYLPLTLALKKNSTCRAIPILFCLQRISLPSPVLSLFIPNIFLLTAGQKMEVALILNTRLKKVWPS